MLWRPVAVTVGGPVALGSQWGGCCHLVQIFNLENNASPYFLLQQVREKLSTVFGLHGRQIGEVFVSIYSKLSENCLNGPQAGVQRSPTS